ncbi:MAG TPA: hypothetical protein VH083_16030, partial [Myxococcales bacterium]|nr:hypothetical protein [Myxococcales bacterium]
CAKLSPFLTGAKVDAKFAARLSELAQAEMPPAVATSFWEGEAALRRDDWDVAREAYKEVVRLLPHNALAQYRLAMTSSLTDPELAHAAIQIALAESKNVASRESKLIEAYAAFLAGDAARAERGYLALLEEYPEDIDARYQLAETYFHLNPLRGRSIEEAEAPLDKVLSYDGKHAALDHQIDLAQLKGQKKIVAELARRSLELGRKDAKEVLPVRWAHAWASGDAVERKQLWAELADPRTGWSALARCFERSIWQGDDLDDAERLANIAIARDQLVQGEPLDKAEGYDFLAVVNLARGRWAEARKNLETAARMVPGHRHTYNLLWASTIEFFPVGDDTLHRDLETARALPAKDEWDLLDGTFMQGALAARLGEDGVASEAAAMLSHRVNELASALPRDLARAVRARVAYQHGKREDARLALEKMELLVPFSSVDRYAQLPEVWLRVRLGQSQIPSGNFLFADYRAAVYQAPLAILRGKQADNAGYRDTALREYQHYLRLRKDADASFAAEINSVHERVKALTSP